MGRQFVVQVDNKPGEVAHLFRVLAEHGVNIEHVASVAAGVRGSVVLSVSDDAATRQALGSASYPFEEGESLVVRVANRPGALAQSTELLAGAGVNVLSVLEVGRYGDSVDLAFTVDNLKLARQALEGSDAAMISWRGN